MQAACMIARYEECAGHVYDMMKVEEKRGRLVAHIVIFSKLSCSKGDKPYDSAGTFERLAPCKLHAKSLPIRENCEFLSHSRRYPGTRCLHVHNYSLLYQLCRT